MFTKKYLYGILLVTLLILLTSVQVVAQTTLLPQLLPLEQTLTASDSQPEDNFGYAIAAAGDQLLVGAPYVDGIDADTGAVYVFKWNGVSYVQQAKLLPVDAAGGQIFGSRLLVQGNALYVTAHQGGGSGAVYVYHRAADTWNFIQKIIAPDATNHFGISVDVDGDTMIIGDFTNNEGAFWAGAAYVFVWNGSQWVFQAKLKNPSPDSQDLIGTNVAIDGDTALVGAYSEDDPFNDSGNVYIFTRSGTTWTLQSTLKPDQPLAGAMFGSGLVLEGDTLVVGAGAHWYATERAVYVFRLVNGQWIQQQHLIMPPLVQPSFGDYFGEQLALQGNHLLVGAQGDNFDNIYTGVAYLYDFNGAFWTLTSAVLPVGANAGDGVGLGLALDNDRIMVGAPWTDTTVSNAGVVYIYKSTPTTELLVNGGFETGNSDVDTPDGWERIKPTGDVRRCTLEDKPTQAMEGRCFYNFVGVPGENSDLKQEIKLSNFAIQNGDQLTMQGYIYPKGDQINTRVRVLVKYGNQPSQKLIARFFIAADTWQLITLQALTLNGDPTVIRMAVNNLGEAGRVRYDAMSLTWQAENGSGLLPLPAAQ